MRGNYGHPACKDSQPALKVSDLWAEIEGKGILRGVTLEVRKGGVCAIMGPNGSGKTTLANLLMGHPAYKVTKGRIELDGEDVTHLDTTQRARKGLFLGFQYPVAIQGVSVNRFLRAALKARGGKDLRAREFLRMLEQPLTDLNLDRSLVSRAVNDGFSGGEKKRLEVLQMLLLRPKVAIMDEPDSGLDVDAMKTVAQGISKAAAQGTTIVLITHYRRLLDYVGPDTVHVIAGGRIVASGGPELAALVEQRGYEALVGVNDPHGDVHPQEAP